jgi:hypothetical protein
MVTFEDYFKATVAAMKRYPSWRPGQAYFNTLVSLRPDISKELETSILDPYYNDSRIPAFLEAVYDIWMG